MRFDPDGADVTHLILRLRGSEISEPDVGGGLCPDLIRRKKTYRRLCLGCEVALGPDQEQYRENQGCSQYD
jgi:hypothetical protein